MERPPPRNPVRKQRRQGQKLFLIHPAHGPLGEGAKIYRLRDQGKLGEIHPHEENRVQFFGEIFLSEKVRCERRALAARRASVPHLHVFIFPSRGRRSFRAILERPSP